MGNAVDVAVADYIKHLLHIDSGRGEENLAEHSVAEELRQRGVEIQSAVGNDLPYEREAVGVYAGRCDADKHVADLDLGAVDELRLLDNTGGVARDVVFAALVHTRHLGGLASYKRAACLAATLCNAGNDGFNLGGLIVADSHVIKEYERLCALGEHVVDTHCDCVDADSVVLVHLEGNLELGTHAVGATDQNRLPDAQGGEVKHSSEGADVAHNARPVGRSYV